MDVKRVLMKGRREMVLVVLFLVYVSASCSDVEQCKEIINGLQPCQQERAKIYSVALSGSHLIFPQNCK